MMPSAISFIALLLLVSSGRHVPAQVQRGVVRGTVSDSAGRRLAGAQIGVINTDIRTMSDAEGRYLLPGVWPGTTSVHVQRLGFQMQTLAVEVKSADTARADFTLQAITSLPGVETSADGSSSRMAAFEQRRARGGGAFITRHDIERRHPNVLSDMLRSVSGVSVKSNAAGGLPVVQIERSSHSISSGTCEVQIYVDGHPYLHGNVDDFPPETVEGVEVYRGGSELPVDFRNQNAGCGLIAIWTRDPSAIRRP